MRVYRYRLGEVCAILMKQPALAWEGKAAVRRVIRHTMATENVGRAYFTRDHRWPLTDGSAYHRWDPVAQKEMREMYGVFVAVRFSEADICTFAGRIRFKCPICGTCGTPRRVLEWDRMKPWDFSGETLVCNWCFASDFDESRRDVRRTIRLINDIERECEHV